MANSRQQLKRAFELIQNDQLDEAITIIRPITEAEPDNADAWWLMANAASEPRDARRALVSVLKINPTYPKARALLDQLNEIHPPRDEELMMMMDIAEPEEPGFPTAAPAVPAKNSLDTMFEDEGVISDDEIANIDALFADDNINTESYASAAPATQEDDWGDDDNPFAEVLEQDARRNAGGRSRLWLLLAAILGLVLIVGAAGLLLVAFSGDDTNEDTADTVDPGQLRPVAPADINAANEANLNAVLTTTQNQARVGLGVGSEANAFYAQMPDGSGYALMVQVCTQPTPSLHSLVRNAIDLVTQNSGDIRDDVAAVGVSVDDCQGNDTLYRVFAPMEAVETYLANRGQEGAFSQFQQSWLISS